MPALDFPQHYAGLLQDLAARLIDSRKAKSENVALARHLLVGFYEICLRCGLDGLVVELDPTNELDITDSSGLSDHPTLLPALVAELGKIDLDAGGPRNAKPGQLVDRLLAALGVTLSEARYQTVTLDGQIRTDVLAALASVADVELALPQLRESIIAKARELCDARHHRAFDQLVAHLDERGMTLIKKPKVPVDALHAVERALAEARNTIIIHVARTAIDRAKLVIERADADAAARIDRPITHRLTPRDVAILRARDARVFKTPAAVVTSLLESLSELSRIVWRAPTRPVRPYAPNQTFAVGDVLEHPKFGRGSVVSCLAQRIEVEFADGKHTLVHAK